MSSIKYRPEIDGLRAIAVISVIIYHLNENWLSGGFLGVDIFFVISGFLITGIIITEIQQNSFSFKQFYTRRIKRIYPAFITAMALVSFIASVIFIYNDFNQLRKTIELATAFLSNFYLGLTQGYFDLSANENPVLHIWSLAVEEQYYLIFPLILILAYKKFREIKVLFIITLILFFILLATSFIPANFYKEVLHQPNIYYLSNLRFPELLVGSLLAIYHNLSNKVQLSKQVNNILAILSTLLLLFSCLFLMNNNIAFIPGITLILPCIFTALIIHTTSQNNIIKLCLSNKVIVFIGKISYSLYLYHWIFIAFAYYITGEKQINNQSIAIVTVLTIIFSVLSYYLIEQPIRKSKLNFKQSFLYIYFIPSLLLLGFNLYKRQTIRAEKEHIEQSIPVSNENHYPAKVIILGDSHSSHLEAFLNYVGNKEGWKADIFKDKFECSFIVNEQYQLDPNCQSVWQKDSQYKAIFISAFYDLRMGGQPVPRFRPETFIEPDFKARFKNTVKQLAMQKPVYVFANNSSVSRSPLRGYLLENYGLEKYLTPIHRMGDIDASNKIIHDLVKDIPNVYWVDAQQYLPKDSVMAEGKYLYGDQDHLTNFGAYYMAKEFSKYQRVMTAEQVKKLYE